VEDVAVAGLPSEERGETVAAWIVPRGDIDLDVLGAFAAERLARYKRPRTLRVVRKLPRNALGKVLKHELPRLESTPP
jgi:acyl-CoA synthetase (AMP-forming)/AMP-acid ligase II